VIERVSEGNDTVNASVNWVLGGNLENLVLAPGLTNLNATGNALNNTLLGNAGNNILNGMGGADQMAGGDGNDTYYVDVAGDSVLELGSGMDTVRSSISYTLNVGIETLFLLGGGTATGNDLANTIFGNSSANVLNGMSGNDRLYGNQGNDTYIVDSSGDRVFETLAVGGGTDVVQASASHVLSANVERLFLTGAGNINGTGNELSNLISGNAGSNFIDGKLGVDNLTGGAGKDTFVFSSALGVSNVDVITDFVAVDDTIRLDDAIFAGLAAGYLAAAAFHVGSSASDGADRIIYNSVNGVVYYDPDGLGGQTQIAFARLDTGLALTRGDFFVF
jgi:Ca2+-binding RTX toxin-like protein